MSIRGDVPAFASARISVHRLAAQLLIMVLCLRALVPIGFMTDAHAAKNGVFKIVICSAHGGNTFVNLDLDLDGREGEPQKSTPSHDQPCALAGLAVDFSGTTENYALITPDMIDIVRFVPARHALMPPARAGPVLGSRAPPA